MNWGRTSCKGMRYVPSAFPLLLADEEHFLVRGKGPHVVGD